MLLVSPFDGNIASSSSAGENGSFRNSVLSLYIVYF